MLRRDTQGCLMPFVQAPSDLPEQLFYRSPVGFYYSDDGHEAKTLTALLKRSYSPDGGSI